MFQSQNSSQERVPEPHSAVQAVAKLFDWDAINGKSPLQPEKLEKLLSGRLDQACRLYAKIPMEQRDAVFSSVLRAFCPRWPLNNTQLSGLDVIFGEGARLPPAAVADAAPHCVLLLAAEVREGVVRRAERFISLLGEECLQDEQVVKAAKDRLLFELSNPDYHEDRGERLLDHVLNSPDISPFVYSIHRAAADPEIQAAVKTYLHGLLTQVGGVLELYAVANLFGVEPYIQGPEFRREAAAHIFKALSAVADAGMQFEDAMDPLYSAIERAAFLDWTPTADNTLPRETCRSLTEVRAVAETIVLRMLKMEQGEDLPDPLLWDGLPYITGLFCSDEFRSSEPVIRACAERIKEGMNATDMLQERMESIRVILGSAAYRSLIQDPSLSSTLLNIACDEIEARKYGGISEWNDSAEYTKAGNIDLVLYIAHCFGPESEAAQQIRELGGGEIADAVDDYREQQEMLERLRASLREVILFKDPMSEETMQLAGRFSSWLGGQDESVSRPVDILHDLLQAHYGQNGQAPADTSDGIIGLYRFMKDPWDLGISPREALQIAARLQARFPGESQSIMNQIPEEERKIDSLESQRLLFMCWDDSERMDHLSDEMESLARSYNGGRNAHYITLLQQTRDTLLRLEPDTLERALAILDVRDKLSAVSHNGVIEGSADQDLVLLEMQMKELCLEAQEALNAARLARADKNAPEELGLDLYRRARQALFKALDIEEAYTAAKIELFTRGEASSSEYTVSHEISTKWEIQSNLILAFLGARQPNRASKQMEHMFQELDRVLKGRPLNANEGHAAVVSPFKAILDTACYMVLHGYRLNASSFTRTALKLHKRAVPELPSPIMNRMDREVVEVRFHLRTTISQIHLGIKSSKVAYRHASAALRLSRIPGFNKKRHHRLVTRMRDVVERTQTGED